MLALADLRIPPGRRTELEIALWRDIASVIARPQGFCAYRTEKDVESPARYPRSIVRLMREFPTAGFRQSQAFTRRREIDGPFFAVPSPVERLSRARAGRAG
jgi:hypothetical protein